MQQLLHTLRNATPYVTLGSEETHVNQKVRLNQFIKINCVSVEFLQELLQGIPPRNTPRKYTKKYSKDHYKDYSKKYFRECS